MATPFRRGVNLGLNKHPDDIKAALALGANHFRWQIHVSPGLAFDSYKVNVLTQVIMLRERVKEFGTANVTVALMTPPGDSRFDRSPEWQKKLPQIWSDISKSLLRVPNILGFDLLNEPTLKTPRWRELAEKTIREVRRVDPKRRCIVSSRKGEPDALSSLGKVEGVALYTVHFYQPMSYTHQGVLPGYPAPRFPSAHEPRNSLLALERSAAKLNKPLYVGEFSATHAAPRASEWLSDVMEWLCKGRIHGAYHAWREADVWNAEKDPACFEALRKYLRFFG